jgi:hypothetical protein
LQGAWLAFRIDGASIQWARALPSGPHVEMHAINGEYGMPGNRNILFLIIGALVVAVAVLGYNLYQEKKEPKGLQINVGPNGLKIENK